MWAARSIAGPFDRSLDRVLACCSLVGQAARWLLACCVAELSEKSKNKKRCKPQFHITFYVNNENDRNHVTTMRAKWESMEPRESGRTWSYLVAPGPSWPYLVASGRDWPCLAVSDRLRT